MKPPRQDRGADGDGWDGASLSLPAGEAAGDVVAGELGDPALRVVEQAHGDEMRVLAHVEPVAGAGRHRDQVVALAEHGVDMLLDMQDEQAAPGDEEAHLVFAMAVLVEELGAQFGLLRWSLFRLTTSTVM